MWFVPTKGLRIHLPAWLTTSFSLHVTQLYCPSCKRIFQAAFLPRFWRCSWRRTPWILRGLCWSGSQCGHTMKSSVRKVIELWVVESKDVSWKIPPLVRWGPSPQWVSSLWCGVWTLRCHKLKLVAELPSKFERNIMHPTLGVRSSANGCADQHWSDGIVSICSRLNSKIVLSTNIP